jgi:DNA-directed RNA polymerase subunit H (RpoH/RPB5)
MDILFTIYKNLHTVLGYRGATLKPSAMLNEDKFMAAMHDPGYVFVYGTRPENDEFKRRPGWVCFALLASSELSGGSSAVKIPMLRQIVKAAYRVRGKAGMIGDHLDIVMPPEENASKPKTLSSRENRGISAEAESLGQGSEPIRVRCLTQEIFVFDIRKHYCSPEHTIVPDPKPIQEESGKPTDWGIIFTTDPQMIYLDGESGMAIKITPPSAAAGHSVNYRICR